jgi:hypothetical protein
MKEIRQAEPGKSGSVLRPRTDKAHVKLAAAIVGELPARVRIPILLRNVVDGQR